MKLTLLSRYKCKNITVFQGPFLSLLSITIRVGIHEAGSVLTLAFWRSTFSKFGNFRFIRKSNVEKFRNISSESLVTHPRVSLPRIFEERRIQCSFFKYASLLIPLLMKRVCLCVSARIRRVTITCDAADYRSRRYLSHLSFNNLINNSTNDKWSENYDSRLFSFFFLNDPFSKRDVSLVCNFLCNEEERTRFNTGKLVLRVLYKESKFVEKWQGKYSFLTLMQRGVPFWILEVQLLEKLLEEKKKERGASTGQGQIILIL